MPAGGVIGVIVAVLMSVVVGCSTSPPAPPPVKRPAVPYSVVWSGASGVDLASRPAELVRASIESGRMAQWAGVDYAFPGYADALSNVTKYSGLFGSTWQKPHKYGSFDGPRTNLYMAHIGEMTHTADRVTATVCAFERSDLTRHKPIPTPVPPNYYVGTSVPHETQPVTYTLELLRSSSAPDQPTGLPDHSVTEHDPRGAKVPSWNVFGDWKIHVMDSDRMGDYTQPPCVAWWARVFPGWSAPANAPWDFAPPYPVKDWTAATGVHGLPINYPEWIERTGDAA